VDVSLACAKDLRNEVCDSQQREPRPKVLRSKQRTALEQNGRAAPLRQEPTAVPEFARWRSTVYRKNRPRVISERSATSPGRLWQGKAGRIKVRFLFAEADVIRRRTPPIKFTHLVRNRNKCQAFAPEMVLSRRGPGGRVVPREAYPDSR
jgi:hypothetical protein